ncbi:MAG TPA: tail fiber domain-containing protein, partial [Pseudobdellovibrionaceae bacterium]
SLDGSGVGAMMGTQLNGLTSGSLTLQPAAVTTNYSLTFPGAQGGAGQTLSNDGSGVLSWITPLTSSSGFVNGGNTFAGNSSIGNNDNFNLDIKTNNISRMTILNNGNVGIGTTSATASFQINSTGNPSTSTILPYFNAIANPSVSVDASYNYGLLTSQTANTRELFTADYLEINPASNLTQSIYGRVMQQTVDAANTYTLGTLVGLSEFNSNFGSGNITTQQGVAITSANRGTASITNQYGLNVGATNVSGTVTNQYGANLTAFNSNTTTVTTQYGAYIRASNSSTGTVTNSTAVYGISDNNTGGTVGYPIGVNGLVQNANGTVSGWAIAVNGGVNNGSTMQSAYGMSGAVSNSGTLNYGSGAAFAVSQGGATTMTQATGVDAAINGTIAGGTITTAYGQHIGFTNVAGSTIGSAYGLYITGLGTGGTWTNTPFDVYAADTTAYNYFAGNVGIGTTAPAYKFDVLISGLVANDYYEVARFGEDTTGKGVGLGYIVNSAGTAISGAFFNAQAGDAYVGTNSNYTALTVKNTTGNVGIGITSPTQALDVVGNIKTSGCLYYASSSLGTCASDERLKKDVKPFDLGLKALLGLKPVNFQYNGLGGFQDDGKTQLGVIAQEVEKAAPELIKKQTVQLHPEDNEKTEIKVVDYGAFTYVIINAFKEFYHETMKRFESQDHAIASKADIAELNELKAKDLAKDQKIQKLEKENTEIRARLEKIEGAIHSK